MGGDGGVLGVGGNWWMGVCACCGGVYFGDDWRGDYDDEGDEDEKDDRKDDGN